MVRLRSYVVVCCSALVAVEARAQLGGLRGAVVDENDQPLEGVEVVVEFVEGSRRVLRFHSDAKGSIVRMGTPMGNARVTLQKEGYGTYSEEVRIRPGAPTRIGTVTLISMESRILAATEEMQADLKAHFEEGIAAGEAENYPAAVAAFEKMLEIHAESSFTHFNLGVVYGKMGETEKAIESFSKAVEIQPDYYEAYMGLGDIYSAQSRWPETLEVLAKAVEARPDSTDGLYIYAAAAMNAADLALAKETLEKLLALDPEHAGGHFQMGMISVNQGENEAAILHLEKYLELEPEGPQAATATGILGHLKQN